MKRLIIKLNLAFGILLSLFILQICENSQMQLLNKIGYTALVLLADLAILLIINRFWARKISYPIGAMIELLKQIKRTEDYSNRISGFSLGDKEITELAEQLNDLLERIEHKSASNRDTKKQLENEATHDSLTGLYNRLAFDERAIERIEYAKKCGTPIIMGFLDIDNFRTFNNQWGHHCGDRVLAKVADALRDNIQGDIGRNGGDEFVFCMNRNTNTKFVQANLQRILDALNTGVEVDDQGTIVPITCSIGAVIEKNPEMTCSALLRKADTAMYYAKEHGKNSYHIISELD